MFYAIRIAMPFLWVIAGYVHGTFIKEINTMTTQNSGIFLAHDDFNSPVILEWEEIHGKTERLSEKIRGLSEVLVPAYVQAEVDFARKKPEMVSNDFMLKSLASLLDSGVNTVDWNLFEQKTKNILEQFFVTMDWTKGTKDQDCSIFVVARDGQTKKAVGVIQFLITPEMAENNIKAALYGVIPSAQNRGLEKLLMSSIFRLRPNAQRIFLHTRSTNQRAIELYEEWGFVQSAGKLPHWTDLEYIVEKSSILQQTSERFVAQK